MKHPILIFSHIPRSGGTSLRKVVRGQYPEARICRVYNAELNLPAPNQTFIEDFKQNKSRYRVVYGHYSYSAHRLLGIPPCYLTVLREPVARVISFFIHLKQGIGSGWSQQIQEDLTLRDMIRKRLLGGVNNHMTRIIAGHPYRKGEVISDTKFLERAKSNIEKHYVFTGTTETLQEDIAALTNLMDWQNVTVPHLKAHSGAHSEIDSETMALILEHNQLDIKLYEWVREQGRAIRPENLSTSETRLSVPATAKDTATPVTEKHLKNKPGEAIWDAPVFIICKNEMESRRLSEALNKHPELAITAHSGLPAFFRYAKIPFDLKDRQRFAEGEFRLMGLLPNHYNAGQKQFFYDGLHELWQQFYREIFPGKNFTFWGDVLPDAKPVPALKSMFPNAQFIYFSDPEKEAVTAEIGVSMDENELQIEFADFQQQPEAVVEKIVTFLKLPSSVQQMSAGVQDRVPLASQKSEPSRQHRFPFWANLRQAGAEAQLQQQPEIQEWLKKIKWDAPLFIVSAGRSGSSHLAGVLNAHPQLAIKMETHLAHIFHLMNQLAVLPVGEIAESGPFRLQGLIPGQYQAPFAELVRAQGMSLWKQFYLQEFPKKRFLRWGDKFQIPMPVPDLIKRFPKAQFIYLVRDGRDRTVSVMQFHERLRKGDPNMPMRNFAEQCHIWNDFNRRYLDIFKNHSQALVVHYEKLVTSPIAEVRRILKFLQLPEAPGPWAFLENKSKKAFAKHGTSKTQAESIGRWKTEMTSTEKDIAHRIMGETLLKFGYDQDV